MDTNRLTRIVFSELINEALKIEEELEMLMNSSMDVNVKTKKIKKLLKKMSINELSLTQFKKLMGIDNNNDKN